MNRIHRAAWAFVGVFALGAWAAAMAAPALPDEFTPQQRAYWAFQPVLRPAAPVLAGAEWGRNAIDGFVLRALREKGLQPSPPAGRITLMRRAYFDLVGLPPEPEDVREFLADDSPRAYERLVERLLASPHYGERWGRHWLDLARFAESDGFEQDGARPNAWRYRDYVTESFNADKPYDRFVREQVAGDELWPDRFDARIATAFNRHYAEEGNQKDLLLARQETLHDVTAVVGSTFLGLTFSCAQCHDHKFDPITQKDYYRLQAFFANVNHDDRFPIAPPDELAEYRRSLSEWEAKTASVWTEMADLLMPYRTYTPEQLLARYPDYVIEAIAKRPGERTATEAWMASLLATKDCGTCPLRPAPYRDPAFRSVVRKLEGSDKDRFEELEAQLEEFAHLKPADIDRGSGIVDVSAHAPPTYVLANGLYTSPREEVQPGFLSILDPRPAAISPPAGGRSTGRRTALAEWLVNPSNPLTARVMANRIWHHHFGRGIVATPGDFGLMGERPSHPDLLDWLADEFVRAGWSLKHVHRLIMLSSTYRQGAGPAASTLLATQGASDADAGVRAASKVDPFNKLLWRFPSRRHDGEAVRDARPSRGRLAQPQGRRPQRVSAAPGGHAEAARRLGRRHGAVASSAAQRVRIRAAELALSDAGCLRLSDTHESCAARNRTVTAPQALALLNGKEPAAWARSFAGRVLGLAGGNPSDQVAAAYRIAYSRSPDPAERDMAMTFLESHSNLLAEDRDQDGGSVRARLTAPGRESRAGGGAGRLLLDAAELERVRVRLLGSMPVPMPNRAPRRQGAVSRRELLSRTGSGLGEPGARPPAVVHRRAALGECRPAQRVGAARAPSRASRQVRDLALYGGRTQSHRPFRPQARTRAARRPSDAAVVQSAGDQRHGLASHAARAVAEAVAAARTERTVGVGLVSPRSRACRRSRGYQVLLVQRRQPRGRQSPDEHRLDSRRTAFFGRMDDLRPRHGERGSARFRRPDGQQGGARRPDQLGSRIPPGDIPGGRTSASRDLRSSTCGRPPT